MARRSASSRKRGSTTIPHGRRTEDASRSLGKDRGAQSDIYLMEMAMDLGASPVEALRRALLRQVAPFLWGASTLVFARSLEDFVVVNSVGNPDSATVTMLLYGSPGEQAGAPRPNVAATAERCYRCCSLESP